MTHTQKVHATVFSAAVALILVLSGTGWVYSYPALNTADAPTIAAAVYGIGPEKAEAIVAERARGGSFRDWSDFADRMAGKGVGPVLAGQVRKSMRMGASK